VLAVWERQVNGHPPIPIGIGEAGYFASDEVTTGPDGWFTLGARTLFNPSLALRVEGPTLHLFKAGYGGWRFVDDAARLTGQGSLIEIHPLGSREERLRHLAGQSYPATIPFERAQRFEAAINAERAALGLLPIGIGYPGLWSDQPQSRIPRGAEDVALAGATAVARDRFGFLYVADTDHHRVVKLTPALEVVAAWGRFGRLDGEFQYPRGIAVDRRGIVYVGDSDNHRIQTCSPPMVGSFISGT
jgi:hypothetical protein